MYKQTEEYAMAMVPVRFKGVAIDVTGLLKIGFQPPPMMVILSSQTTKEPDEVLTINITPEECWIISEIVQGFPYKCLDFVKSKLERVELTKNGDNFCSVLHTNSGGVCCKIEMRPAIAIAWALQETAPIFVDTTSFTWESISTDGKADDTLKDHISRIEPEDFGNYTLPKSPKKI